jgi:hypothetical protein
MLGIDTPGVDLCLPVTSSLSPVLYYKPQMLRVQSFPESLSSRLSPSVTDINAFPSFKLDLSGLSGVAFGLSTFNSADMLQNQ